MIDDDIQFDNRYSALSTLIDHNSTMLFALSLGAE